VAWINQHVMSGPLMRWNFRNVAPNGMLLSGNYLSSLEYQMSKRKPAMAPKHAYRPSIAAKAQQASQTIVRSPKNSVPRAVGGGSTEPSPEHHTHPEQDAPFVEHAELLTKDPETSLQDDSKQITENDSKKRIDFLSSANANVRTYQAKLLEMAQANMQFAFEFAQRLAAIRSPVEFPGVIAEFTSKRIVMFRKHSTEMTELSTKPWTS
jgi:Phasin protein